MFIYGFAILWIVYNIIISKMCIDMGKMCIGETSKNLSHRHLIKQRTK